MAWSDLAVALDRLLVLIGTLAALVEVRPLARVYRHLQRYWHRRDKELDNTDLTRLRQRSAAALERTLLRACGEGEEDAELTRQQSVFALERALLNHAESTEEEEEEAEAPEELNRTVNPEEAQVVEDDKKQEAEKEPSLEEERTGQCCICLDDFATEADGITASVRMLPCGHSFHAACVNAWISAGKPCPLCREWPLWPVSESPSDTTATTDLDEVASQDMSPVTVTFLV